MRWEITRPFFGLEEAFLEAAELGPSGGFLGAAALAPLAVPSGFLLSLGLGAPSSEGESEAAGEGEGGGGGEGEAGASVVASRPFSSTLRSGFTSRLAWSSFIFDLSET
ncbi:hypothetical protein KM043_000917 [Ampulex compressa]|nr:hypothetical protein KM043_000917 [Ampulex compressa]